MGIGEGWIYSKSFLCTKQAAFCSLFMPVIIKICVFAFVYSASLVETTCGLFPIFRWSGVPTRVPARNIEIDLFSSADNQPTLLATASWIYYLVLHMEILKSTKLTRTDPGDSSILGLFFQSWDWQHSVLRRHFSLLRRCVSVKVHWSIGLGARFTQLLKKWKSVFLGPTYVSLAAHRLKHQCSCSVA